MGSDRYRTPYEPEISQIALLKAFEPLPGVCKATEEEFGDAGVHFALGQDGRVLCRGD